MQPAPGGIAGGPGEVRFFAYEGMACHYVKKRGPDSSAGLPYDVGDFQEWITGHPDGVAGRQHVMINQPNGDTGLPGEVADRSNEVARRSEEVARRPNQYPGHPNQKKT